MKKVAILTLILAGLTGFQVHAATGTAKAQMKVLAALNITKTSDLVFSEAAAGALAETVLPETTETAQNASFTITGEPNRAITINLPTDGTVVMRKGAGGTADTEVAVNSFAMSPMTNIDSSGTSILYVGATRADLSVTQEGGDYEADFDVEVIY